MCSTRVFCQISDLKFCFLFFYFLKLILDKHDASPNVPAKQTNVSNTYPWQSAISTTSSLHKKEHCGIKSLPNACVHILNYIKIHMTVRRDPRQRSVVPSNKRCKNNRYISFCPGSTREWFHSRLAQETSGRSEKTESPVLPETIHASMQNRDSEFTTIPLMLVRVSCTHRRMRRCSTKILSRKSFDIRRRWQMTFSLSLF